MIRTLVLVILAAVSISSAADAPVLSRIIKQDVMRVGMTLQQPPLNAKDETGEIVGLEVDLARILASAFDVELQVVQKPFPDLLPALEKGEVDMVMSGMGITAERSLEVTFVGPYLLSGKSLITKSNAIASIMDAEDLEDEELTIAVLGGSTSEPYVKKQIAHAKVVSTKDYAAAIELVRADKADAMVVDMPICVLAALKYEEEGMQTLAQPLTIEPVGVAILDGDPKLRNLLQNYLTAIEDNGILELLKGKWFEDSSWVDSLP